MTLNTKTKAENTDENFVESLNFDFFLVQLKFAFRIWPVLTFVVMLAE